MKKSWNKPTIYNLRAQMTEMYLHSNGADLAFEEAAQTPEDEIEIGDLTGSTNPRT